MSLTQPANTPNLSDPLVAASCLDFLLIELVPLAQRITDQLLARDAALREDYKRSQIFHDQPPASETKDNKASEAAAITDIGSVGGAPTDNTTNTAAGGVDEETKDAVFWRLDGMGYRVGQGLVERWV